MTPESCPLVKLLLGVALGELVFIVGLSMTVKRLGETVDKIVDYLSDDGEEVL